MQYVNSGDKSLPGLTRRADKVTIIRIRWSIVGVTYLSYLDEAIIDRYNRVNSESIIRFYIKLEHTIVQTVYINLNVGWTRLLQNFHIIADNVRLLN
jgi:hypothetical protein